MSEWLPYPSGTWRELAKLPLTLYRAGLGEWVNRAHLLILITRGRKTGQPRFTPILYRRHGSKVYVISGWRDRPQWVQNLLADPRAALQIGTTWQAVCAEIVTDASEALRALHLFRRRAPFIYDAVLARLSNRETVDARTLPEITDEFTIVRFEPTGEPTDLPRVPTDLPWLLPGLGVALGVLLLFALRPRHRDE